MTKFKLQKMTKINLKIAAKRHANLHFLTKHQQSFKMIQLKLKGELRSQDWTVVMDSQTDTRGKNKMPGL